MFQYISNSPEATAELATKLAAVIKPGTIICLEGDLGAGKTLFVQNLAKALGIEENVTSPTFNLMNTYEGKMVMYHFDLYRLEQEYELEDIGFYDYISDGDGLVVIEWADKFCDCLPDDYILLDIQRAEDVENQRILSFSLRGEALEDVYKEMEKLCRF